jgi:hypothetical protein
MTVLATGPWCKIPEDGILHSHCRENHKFYRPYLNTDNRLCIDALLDGPFVIKEFHLHVKLELYCSDGHLLHNPVYLQIFNISL